MKTSRGLLPVLFAVLELGCNTGLVSIGDDRMLACGPEDCGQMPSDAPVCSEFSMGRYECGRDMDETCSWFLSCPSASCPSSACGVAPAERPMCLDGVWGSGWACDPVEMGCGWQGICPEHARECPPEDCGMASGPVAECMGGGSEGLSCLRAENDACRWTSVACAPPP
ncbi:MAG TPA: hypothetical protein VFU02_23055 [Polyangiaceae bacterium]|nr:hypothetical protein [Polyangiaceae bacterium]